MRDECGSSALAGSYSQQHLATDFSHGALCRCAYFKSLRLLVLTLLALVKSSYRHTSEICVWVNVRMNLNSFDSEKIMKYPM